MPKDETCKYCTESKELLSILIKIRDLETSTLFLFRDQTHPGRCVLALKDHKTEIFQLGADELAAFGRDTARAAKAIHRAFAPGKINYAVYGDLAPHFHLHLVPKYPNAAAWGKPFELMPDKFRSSSDEEYKETIKRIEAGL